MELDPELPAGSRVQIEEKAPTAEGALKGALVQAGGAMAGVRSYHLLLGSLPPGIEQEGGTFFCTHHKGARGDVCCDPAECVVRSP